MPDDGGPVDASVELDLGDEVLVVVEDLASFGGQLVVGIDDVEAAVEIAELDMWLDGAEAGKEVVGELVHVALAGVGGELDEGLANERRLLQVGKAVFGDHAEIDGS